MSSTDVVEAVRTSSAMACQVTVRAPTEGACERALAVFADVDRECTRFDERSDLMRANARGDSWVPVGARCFLALVEAAAAYRRTQGRFDPRVLDDLVRLGYAASYTRGRPQAPDPGRALASRQPRPAWTPGFRGSSREVRIGPHPVDLGGIGKGLAVRWAAEVLREQGCTSYLVEAGGDCFCAGRPADAAAWRVAVEDPASRLGTDQPVAVLQIVDKAAATSSTRLRQWAVGDTQVHHLVDPVDGRPGGAGLTAVTVVDDDPANAEVWSKVLFLAGARGVAATAELLRIPALWVGADGSVAWSGQLEPHLLWTSRGSHR